MNNINKPATLEEIADVMGKNKTSIQRTANAEGWKFTTEKTKGRYDRKLFTLKGLPLDIQHSLLNKRIDSTAGQTHNNQQDKNNGSSKKYGISKPNDARPGTATSGHEALADSGTSTNSDTNKADGDRSGGHGTRMVSGERGRLQQHKAHRGSSVHDAGGKASGVIEDTGIGETGLSDADGGRSLAVNGVGLDGSQVLDGVPARLGSNAVLAKSNLPPLDETQIRVHEAIKHIVKYVNGSGLPKRKALILLNTEYASGGLSKTLRWAIEHAWEKRRANCVLSVSTYNKWLANFKKRGHYAPMKRQKDFSLTAWHVLAAELKRRPQGSSKKWIHAELVKVLGKEAPGYDAMCFWFREKFSEKDQLEGRYTGSQLRSKKFYQHRTNEGLEPATLVHADGWNTHFSAPHPVTGEFVTYEVWHFHDVATRYVPTPGIGLTENAAVIVKGLENLVRELGVPARLQTDSTKVVRGSDRFTKAMHSLEERLGFTWTHPKEVGNSQANGIAENFNTSWLDKRSRELATYQNRNSMDDLTFKRVRKLTAQMVKAGNNGELELREQKKREIERISKGHVFDSYGEAFAWIVQICREFNDRPHSALKKVTDPETGKRRHQTPREALNEFIDDGWVPYALDEQELIDAFRPHVQVKVRRETVSPWGGMRYMNPEVLSHFNGKEVIVAYDISDYQTVWVKDLKGTPICEATFVEAARYHALTAQQADEEKRAIAALKRLDKKRDKVIAGVPQHVIEGEVLTRIPAIPQETIEPLIRVQPIAKEQEEPLKPLIIEGGFNRQEPEEERTMTYQETVEMIEKMKKAKNQGG
jgi:putative transposase